MSATVSIQDLKNPTASFVQLVYIRFLQDFGFNTSAMLVPSMELMESLDHPEVPNITVYLGSISLIILYDSSILIGVWRKYCVFFFSN